MPPRRPARGRTSSRSRSAAPRPGPRRRGHVPRSRRRSAARRTSTFHSRARSERPWRSAPRTPGAGMLVDLLAEHADEGEALGQVAVARGLRLGEEPAVLEGRQHHGLVADLGGVCLELAREPQQELLVAAAARRGARSTSVKGVARPRVAAASHGRSGSPRPAAPGRRHGQRARGGRTASPARAVRRRPAARKRCASVSMPSARTSAPVRSASALIAFTVRATFAVGRVLDQAQVELHDVGSQERHQRKRAIVRADIVERDSDAGAAHPLDRREQLRRAGGEGALRDLDEHAQAARPDLLERHVAEQLAVHRVRLDVHEQRDAVRPARWPTHPGSRPRGRRGRARPAGRCAALRRTARPAMRAAIPRARGRAPRSPRRPATGCRRSAGRPNAGRRRRSGPAA